MIQTFLYRQKRSALRFLANVLRAEGEDYPEDVIESPLPGLYQPSLAEGLYKRLAATMPVEESLSVLGQAARNSFFRAGPVKRIWAETVTKADADTALDYLRQGARVDELTYAVTETLLNHGSPLFKARPEETLATVKYAADTCSDTCGSDIFSKKLRELLERLKMGEASPQPLT